MDIYCYRLEGTKAAECLGVLDSYSSLDFTKSFQGCGFFTVKGLYTEGAAALLAVGNLVRLSDKVAGIVHSIDYSVDEEGEVSYTAYGMELKGMLGYRIVWDTYTHNLPAAKWIEGLVKENTTGNRTLCTVKESGISCPNLDKQVSYTSLLEAVEDACAAQATSKGLMLGFDVLLQKDGTFSFTLVEGADRTHNSPEPYIVSRDMDNVATLALAVSDKEKATVIKAGGEGEGAKRKFATAGDFSLKGFARREAFVDARELQSTYIAADGSQGTMTDAEYAAALQQKASASIVDDTLSLDAETVHIFGDAVPLLGAKITVLDRQFGVWADDYVTSINIIDEAGGAYTTLTIGEGLTAKSLVF